MGDGFAAAAQVVLWLPGNKGTKKNRNNLPYIGTRAESGYQGSVYSLIHVLRRRVCRKEGEDVQRLKSFVVDDRLMTVPRRAVFHRLGPH